MSDDEDQGGISIDVACGPSMVQLAIRHTKGEGFVLPLKVDEARALGRHLVAKAELQEQINQGMERPNEPGLSTGQPLSGKEAADQIDTIFAKKPTPQ